MTKRIFAVLVGLIMTIGVFSQAATTENIRSMPVSVSVNNQFITTEEDTFNYKGVAYGPLRTVASAMGAYSVEWNPSSRSATVSFDNGQLTVTTDSSIALVNGKKSDMSYPAVLHNGRLSLPLGTMVSLLDGECYWLKETLHMQIYKKGVTTPSEYIHNRGYNEDDVIWLSKIINAESEGESLEGKIAVGNVVLNRVNNQDYPDTIYGVIFDKKHGVQFEPVMNGSVYRDPNADSILAAKLALEGESHAGSSLFFCNPVTSTNSWIINNRPFYSMIGKHAFFL